MYKQAAPFPINNKTVRKGKNYCGTIATIPTISQHTTAEILPYPANMYFFNTTDTVFGLYYIREHY